MPQTRLSTPSTPRLSSGQLRAALDTLHAIGEACTGSTDFARRGVEHLPRLVGSDLTTLVVCDLERGHRTVAPSGMVSRREIEVFDRYFYEHPLVREHGRNPNAVTKRIDDLVAPAEFHRTPLYNDYYRPIRIEHAMAVPIHVDGRFLVSFVFNRSATGFTERDRDLAEVMRPHLANLYRLGVAIEKTRELPADAPFDRAAAPLTSREREVLDWVAAGKTNRDVAAILGASPRTVEKHLERIYEKLGVETRTAAVMRVLKNDRTLNG
ncbi:MAG TPA: helix-turn-helix transcriptional regulator [Burkholderiales bacterium]|nr:helix-turn-helix transcriptional regulator [Burkholderiales bacterium]